MHFPTRSAAATSNVQNARHLIAAPCDVRIHPATCTLRFCAFHSRHLVKALAVLSTVGAGRGRMQAPRRVQQAECVAFGGVMPTKRILITGGAGFIGSNAARYFGARNWTVTVLDNLSRAGAEKNLVWLRDGTTFDFEQVDVRDRARH